MIRALGIDIGGTKIGIGIIDETGRVAAQSRIPTDPEAGFDSAIQRISETAAEMLSAVGIGTADLVGVGVGCAGPVNPFTGVIHNDFTLPSWGGKNIVQALGDEWNRPVFLENDADAALIGEAFAGAGRGAKNLVMLTFGTGIGGAVLNNGQIYRGANGEHPEIGHFPFDPSGPPCYCGNSGCLEATASGPAIAAAGKTFGFSSAEEIFRASDAGDEHAKRIIDRVLDASCTALWSIIHSFLPERLILGGGIMDAHYTVFEPRLLDVISRAALRPSTGMRLCRAQLGNEAGLVGAGLLAIRRTGTID